MYNIPIIQPRINKSNHFLMNLPNLNRFVKNILQTILVIMKNTIYVKIKNHHQINFFNQANNVPGISLKGRRMVSSRLGASSLSGESDLHGSSGSSSFRSNVPPRSKMANMSQTFSVNNSQTISGDIKTS